MPNLLRVRTVWNYGAGSPGMSTFYFGNDGGDYNNADAQIAVDRVRDALNFNTGIFATGQTWSISGEVDKFDPVTGEVLGAYAVTQRSGFGTDPNGLGPLPAGVLLRMKTDTYVGGRRLVGRTYFVPIGQVAMRAAVVGAGTKAIVEGMGNELNDAGLTLIFPYVWSRPRPATAVGPGRPAGPARSFRAGSSARATSFECGPNFVVLTSRRD